jgi:UDP-N-acetylmuramate dehydrogenase
MKILNDLSLADLSHLKVGKKPEHLYFPESYDELQCLYQHYHKNFQIIPLGGCSNILFGKTNHAVLISDKYLPWKWVINENQLLVSANMNINYMIKKLAGYGLGGLEFLAGIPAHAGGLTYMNAGAYQKCMADYVDWVRVFDQDGERVLDKNDCQFSYRHSAINAFIVEIALSLDKETKEGILEKMLSNILQRKQKQPLLEPNLGCFFKNPENQSAGQLIDQLGLKGYCIGDAMISCKHANFIVNRGKAQFEEIMALIQYVQKRVKEEYHINLELEVKVISE